MPEQPFTWRHQYDPVVDDYWGTITATEIIGESLTMQKFTKDADLNVIMERFGVTDGAIPPAALDARFFGDFSDEVDLQEAFRRTREAQERFDALPADIRRQFRNDPAELFAFVLEPENHDKAVELGLLKRVPKTQPASEPVSVST